MKKCLVTHCIPDYGCDQGYGDSNDCLEYLGNTLGEALVRLRKIKGLSQQELGQKVGKDETYILEVEQNVLLPSADEISQLCEAISVPPYRLLSFTGGLPTRIKSFVSRSEAAQKLLCVAEKVGLQEADWELIRNSLYIIVRCRGIKD